MLHWITGDEVEGLTTSDETEESICLGVTAPTAEAVGLNDVYVNL